MTSTNRVELKCTTDSELPWKMVAKGSISSTRHDKKSNVRVAASDIDHAEDKSSTEPEKLLGHHFAERVEHVPIKKRRFMVLSPSPKNSSGRCGSSKHRMHSNHALPVSRLNPNLIGGGTSDGCSEKPDCNGHAFSGKKDIIAPQKSSVESFCNDLADEQSTEQNKVVFGGMLSAKHTSILPVNTMSNKSPAGESTEKKNKSFKNVRLHWDLNVPMDAWSQPCNVEDDASERELDVEVEITESMDPKESQLTDGCKDHQDGSKGEAAARNGKKCQSGYESQLEEGELREPYSWEENEGDAGEDDGFYSMVESNDKKMEDSDKTILADAPRIGEVNEESDIEKHVVAFKELPSHDATKRIRYDYYEDLGMDPYKSFGRDDRSRMRMRAKSSRRGYFSGWGSRRRFSSPNYKCGFYGFEWPQPEGMIYDPGMIDGFDQSRPWSQLDAYVCHPFWDGEYHNRFRMFNNQFPGWVHNWMSGNMRERGNSPVFRRLHYTQSESRSRSRSPVPRNGRNGLYPPRDGFRAGKRMMERLRFPADQEMSFMSPPRNRMSSQRLFERRGNDSGENHNSFRERKFRPGKKLGVGNSLRRLNSDNDNNFIRHKRFDGVEDNIGGNKFEMAQQQAKPAEVLEDDNDDIRRFRFSEKQSVVVANKRNDDITL